ncbi:hypothetical protein ASG93_13815 [Paenibacillus sp. Soil787]|nr:hypothetical protein ASG93_13815 [Paenibacillus sp. Soil787]
MWIYKMKMPFEVPEKKQIRVIINSIVMQGVFPLKGSGYKYHRLNSLRCFPKDTNNFNESEN